MRYQGDSWPVFMLTFFVCRCLKMSWRDWSRTSWQRETTPLASWLWDRLLTWSWPAPWEGLAPWLLPSVSGSVRRCIHLCLLWGLMCVSSGCVHHTNWLSSLLVSEFFDTCDSEQPWNCRKGRKLLTAFSIVCATLMTTQQRVIAVCRGNYVSMTYGLTDKVNVWNKL